MNAAASHTATAVLFLLLAQSALQPSAVRADDPRPKETRLAEYLSGTQFVGKFTVDGADNDPKTETYTIKSCEKLPTADLYRLTARIKYGQVDQEVPLDLKILWSGDTPVITLESIWIPGMGTFDAHVLIRAGRYAGTWQHGDKGGHLFGKIVPLAETDSDKSKTPSSDDSSDGKP
ncbi:hypothetical protein NHH03_01980 [Stieleria sp. TO1_6]|nr:hypothetical protein [Stieleria tagensis]